MQASPNRNVLQPSSDGEAATPVFAIVPGQDPIGLIAFRADLPDDFSYEQLQTKRWFVENVRQDWIIFDVGADIGCYSLLCSRLAPDGAVYAFEPNSMALLRKNLRYHHADNVRTFPTALVTAPHLIGRDNSPNYGEGPEHARRRFETIDEVIASLGLQRLDCMKIDIEGCIDVLEGAERTLRILNPWLVLTRNSRLANWRDTIGQALEWLVARGHSSARVLDDEHYVLRRDDAPRPADESPQLRLTFEQRPVVLREEWVRGEPVANYFLSQPVLHGKASTSTPEDTNGSIIAVPGPRWSYAASWAKSPSATIHGRLVVEIEMTVKAGEVGIGCVSPAMDAYVGNEIFVGSAGRQQIGLSVPDGTAVGHLMLRNAGPSGGEASVCVHGIRASRAIPAYARLASPLLAADKQKVSLAECEVALSGIESSPLSASQNEQGIAIVPVEKLGAALAFSRPFVAERKVFKYGLAGFRTETDEAAIYKYIYSNAKPKRHLEFGTWEGFGVTLCAGVCDAEIWTINLPEGETDAEGNAAYGSTDSRLGADTPGLRGDSGNQIGWRYREAGFAPRVHQILCDSREFDPSQFPPEYFDTILIDGGHKPDLVRNDTEKALPLLKPGGIIIWHDFCPDVDVLRLHEAPRGVVRAVVDNFSSWSSYFRKLMWVRPSWMLLGVKL